MGKLLIPTAAIRDGLVALDIAIDLLLFPGVHWRDEKLRSGRLLDSTAAQAGMVMTAAGICFFPLLVLEPALSFREAWRFSRSATEINGRRTISWLMVGMLFVVALLGLFVPAFGLTTAAWIVFVGVLNYVAYRDIFERQSTNLPEAVATASIVVAAPAID
jgi:hypothetical protein